MKFLNGFISSVVIFASIGAACGNASAVEPNGRARLLVKRDLRLFALDYEDLMKLVAENQVLVDLVMVAVPAPGRSADLGFNQAHLFTSGKNLDQILMEIKKRYGDVIEPDHVVEVFKSSEITLFRLSKATPDIRNYVLQPGDIVMIRRVSDI